MSRTAYYQVMNHVDEQGRMFKLPTYTLVLEEQRGQCISHGFSYVQCRAMLEEMGEHLGLDRILKDHELQKLIDCSG